MKRSLTAFTLAAGIAAPALAADSYTIDSRHTYPVFEVNHLGFSTQRGRFNKVSGRIVLDVAAKKGSVDLTIDVASIDMGAEDWDKHLKAEGFFNVEKFPTASFKSDTLVFEGDKLVAAEGQFTLLGVTKPLHVAVTGFRCGVNPINKKQACGADVSATIRRSEFGMTKYVPAVSDEVRIIAPVEAFRD